MKLSDILKFADEIKDAVSSAMLTLEAKFDSSVDAVTNRIEAIESKYESFVTADQIEAAIKLFELKEEEFFASMEEKSSSLGVQVKSATAEGGTILFEYTDGRIDEIEIPVIPGPAGAKGLDGLNGERGLDGVNGKDGIDGKHGKDGESGRDGVDGADGKNGVDGKDGKDGVGIKSIDTKQGEFSIYLTSGEEYRVELPKPQEPSIPRAPIDVKDAMQDKEGHLVLVFSDGTTRDVGRVAGRDGLNGVDGINGEKGERGEPGIDGRNGYDGRDGLGFDDMSAELKEDGRTVVFRFERGETVKEFPMKFPAMIFRGAYVPDTVYERGDVVSFNGSTFHANKEVIGEVPGTTDSWTQQTQAGRSIRGERGLPGNDGRNGLNGRDFTPRS